MPSQLDTGGGHDAKYGNHPGVIRKPCDPRRNNLFGFNVSLPWIPAPNHARFLLLGRGARKSCQKNNSPQNPLILTQWSSLPNPQEDVGCTPLRVELSTPRSRTQSWKCPQGATDPRLKLWGTPWWEGPISGVPRAGAGADTCLRLLF